MLDENKNENNQSHPEEFFIAGGAMKLGVSSYIKRPADDELYNAIRRGELCYILTPRQMGKSSLMVQTAARLRQKGVQTAIVDLTRIGSGETVDQWYLGLVNRLKRELNLKTDLQIWWQERQNLPLVLRFTNFLREVILEEIKEQVVIFIDEIDYTLGLDYTDEFFAAIRATFNAHADDSEYERLTFVLLGVATPADLIKDRSRTPFNVGLRIDLREFTQQDAQILFDKLKAYVPEKTEEVFDRIFSWTNGHPYLTQGLCLEIAVSTKENWDADAVDKLVYKLFLSDKSNRETNLQFMREYISSSQQGERLLKLYEQVYRGGIVEEEERSQPQNQLKLIGLLQVEDGEPPRKLYVRNKVYREVFNQAWIDVTMPPKSPYRQYIAYALAGLVLLLLLAFGIFAVRNRFFSSETPTSTAVVKTANTPTIESVQTLINETAESTTTITALPPTVVPTSTSTALTTTIPPTTITLSPTATNTPLFTNTPIPATMTPTEAPVVNTPAATLRPPAPVLTNHLCDNLTTYNAGDTVFLEWTWNGRLLPNEYLELRVGENGARNYLYRQRIGEGALLYGVRLPDLLPFYPNANSFEWRIVHMAANQQTENAISFRGCFNFNDE